MYLRPSAVNRTDVSNHIQSQQLQPRSKPSRISIITFTAVPCSEASALNLPRGQITGLLTLLVVKDLSAAQEAAMVPCMEEYLLDSSRHNGYKKCGEVQLNVSVEKLVDERIEFNDNYF